MKIPRHIRNYALFGYNIFTPLPKTKKPLLEKSLRKKADLLRLKRYRGGFYSPL